MKLFTKSLFILVALMITVAGAQERWYKYEVGKPYKYIGEMKQQIQQVAMGQTVNVTMESNASYSITVLEYMEDGSMKAQLDIKSAVMFTEDPSGLKTLGEDLANKSFTFQISPKGHVSDFDSTINSVADESQGMAMMMADFLPNLPAEKLENGESWTVERADTSTTAQTTLVTERESEYEVDGTADVNGVSTLNIKQTGEVSVEGDREIRGQTFAVMGEGTFEGHIYLAKDLGIVKKIELNNKMEQVISEASNPQMQFTITTTMTQKTEQVSE